MAKLVVIVGPEEETRAVAHKLRSDGVALPVVSLLSDCWTLSSAVKVLEGAGTVVVIDGELTTVGPARRAWEALKGRFDKSAIQMADGQDRKGIARIINAQKPKHVASNDKVKGMEGLPATGRWYLGRFGRTS